MEDIDYIEFQHLLGYQTNLRNPFEGTYFINEKHWSGPTKALLDTLGITKLKFKRFPFNPYIHYAVL